MILNEGPVLITDSLKSMSKLWDIMLRIAKSHFKSDGIPDYEAIRLSSEYVEYLDEVKVLQGMDPVRLQAQNERKVFWINIYNMLAIHAIIRFHIKLTVWERPNFFYSAEYNIGGYRFSLHDIYQGILRGNKKWGIFFPPPFRSNDTRKKYLISDPDPRVHFAISFGARSSPPVKVFQSNSIEADLEEVTRSFINQGISYSKETATIYCSKIFKWYSRDFGDSKDSLIRFIGKYVDNIELRDEILNDGKKIRIKYQSFDWHLV